MKKLISIVIIIVMVIICGCQEEHTAPAKIYGQGDLPQGWIDYFGDDNNARLNLIQTNRINNLGKAVAGLQIKVKRLEEKESTDAKQELSKAPGQTGGQSEGAGNSPENTNNSPQGPTR
jgi:hypothetical protein